ncbi:CD59 glycoprotein-like [Engraulis encrasicolus]|uniref:CD59 glycoprotein-like n=1 Tax=Engraulis encrasicolus TaxID=184585 RepID=UPI002FCE7E99
MSVKSSSLLILLLATMLATADALQCYVCGDAQCSTTSRMTCPLLMDSCLKTVHKTGAVLKSCGLKAACDVPVPDPKTYCCEGDLCNSAGPVGKNLLLLLVPLASIFVLS